MSTGAIKEIGFNGESSVALKLDAEKVEEPEQSSYGAKRDKDPPRKNEEGRKNLIDDSKSVDEKICSTRYFIIKSLNYENIQLSVEKGIWATQVMNERILEEAFNNSRKVILIFSVNASGFFQGYAEMMSSVGRRRDRGWSQGGNANNPWGRSFQVKWLRLSNLPFYKTLHLKNPLNEYKPVKISRDCQELPPDIGGALCELIDRQLEEDPNPQRDTLLARRPDLAPGYPFPEEACNAPSVDMTSATTSMFHPSFIYNYHAEASRWHLAHGSVGLHPPEFLPVMANKGSVIRYPHRRGNMWNSPVESDISSQVDSWPMSGEISPLGSTVTEDEFLEMSYEEYVEAYTRSTKELCQPAGGLSQREDASSSKEHESDDMHNHSDPVNSREKKSRH